MIDEHSRTSALMPSLELTVGTSATNYINWPFQALSKNVLIRTVVVFSALETFCFNNKWAIYVYFTYLLTYFHSTLLPA